VSRLIDADTSRSPGWYLKRLLAKLASGQVRYDLLDQYYRGENGIPVNASKACTDAYRRLMHISRTNFAELIVEATRERVNLLGFRTAAGGDENGDAEAQRIMRANGLSADSALVHRTTFSLSDAYVIVGGVDEEIGAPLITPEDPRQVVIEYDPARRRKAVAALKVFRDDAEIVDRAYLYLPGQVWRAKAPALGEKVRLEWGAWSWDDKPQKLPAPIVPVVRFANRPDLWGNGVAEFEPHIPLLDRISYTVLSRIEIATLQAFRQRAIKGLPLKDADGNEVNYDDIFSLDPGALWQLPAAAEMWESGTVDLGPVRLAIRDDIQDLAAVTRVPMHYLSPDSANGSAEGASLAREGLVFKVSDRLVSIAERWQQVMHYAFVFAKDEKRANLLALEAIFAAPDRVSMAERYDAASKAAAAGVPWRTRMTDVLQFTPDAVARMEIERAEEALLAGLDTQPSTPEPAPEEEPTA
jgi:hypothetical protein